MPHTPCLTDAELGAYLRGQMPPEALEEAAAHLDTCPLCEGAAARLEALPDTMVHVLREPAPAPDRPTVIGEHEVLGSIGQGGMGVVYRARHLRLGRLVALKMMLGAEAASPDERARFRREAEAAARLQHPNIVQVFEVGECKVGSGPPWPYFTLELVEGESLATRLAGRPQPPRQAAIWLKAIAAGVQHAHENGVVHRDLKPSNVLLGRDGSVKVCDFGVAKLLASEGLTDTGMVMGTAEYMAPEQAQGAAQVGPAADIYSLGAILYTVLTGHPPFQGTTPFETVLHTQTRDPIPPRRLQPNIPRDLDTICLKCLAKDPRKRYASASELADDLQRFLAGQPIRARAVGRLERLGKWARRHPALAVLLAVLAALLVFGLPGVTSLWLSAASARGQATRKAREAVQAKEEADGLRRKAERREARLALDRGQALCQRGALPGGLLWLARALERAHDLQDEDLERVARLNLAEWGAQLAQPGPALRARAEADAVGAAISRLQEVNALAAIPDSSMVLVGVGGVLQVWDIRKGALVGRPLVEPGLGAFRTVWSLAVSRDGSAALVGRAAGTARLWDLRRRKASFLLAHGGVDDNVWGVAFSPDGSALVTAGSAGERGVVRLWDRGTGKPLGAALEHPAEVMKVAFSPDGLTLACACADAKVWLWDVATRKVVGQLPHRDKVLAVCFSPDGTQLLSGCRDGNAQLWDIKERQRLGDPLSHVGDVTGVAFSPDGRTVLTGSRDGTSRLWVASSRQPLGAPLAQEEGVHAVAFSADGKSCLSGGRDGTVQVWHLPPPRALGPPLRNPQPVFELGFRPDGRRLLSVSQNQALLWDLDRYEVALKFVSTAPDRLAHRFHAAAYAPDGVRVALSTWAPGAILWEVEGRPEPATSWLAQHPGEKGSPVALAFAGADRLLTVREEERQKAHLWSLKDPRAPVRTFALPPAAPGLIHGLATASSPGARLLAACTNHTVYLWEVETGTLLRSWSCPSAPTALAVRQDEGAVLAGCSDGSVHLWDADTGQLRLSFRDEGKVLAVALSADGRYALTGSAARAARLWDVATGVAVGPPLGHKGAVGAVAFGPGGKVLATGSRDRTAQLWRGPEQLQGPVGLVRAWAELLAGLELTPEGDERPLTPEGRAERQRLLTEPGNAGFAPLAGR